MWWKRKLDLKGAVFFKGAVAPSLLDLRGLTEAGLAVAPRAPAQGEIWVADLRHPQWGNARLAARRGPELPLDALVQFASGVTETERETILRDAKSALALDVAPQTGDVLRDRKQFLRFMAAVLGQDGVAGLDLMAQMFWSRERLADELQHDAALDIIQMHVLHAVTQPGGLWLHSHGLAEMGFVDFDVLRPAPELIENQFDLLRSIAFHIVEGSVSGPIEPALGADAIDLVDAGTFMSSASTADRELRNPADHSQRRVVCCDPAPTGFVGRLLGGKNLRPSTLLSRGMVEGKHLIRFSDLATDLTAARARDSLSLLEPFRAEFEDMKCTAVVKLGYPTDSGQGGREHLWFEVHGVAGDSIDGTLLNEPFDIAGMKAGERSGRPVELLSDWAIVTPIGQLTPRTLEVARKLRERRPEILQALREMPL